MSLSMSIRPSSNCYQMTQTDSPPLAMISVILYLSYIHKAGISLFSPFDRNLKMSRTY